MLIDIFQTSLVTQKRFRPPLQLPEIGTLQSFELSARGTVCPSFPGFMNCHPCRVGLFGLQFSLSHLCSCKSLLTNTCVHNSAKLIGSLSWTLIVSLLWPVVDSLCGVDKNLFTSPGNTTLSFCCQTWNPSSLLSSHTPSPSIYQFSFTLLLMCVLEFKSFIAFELSIPPWCQAHGRVM